MSLVGAWSFQFLTVAHNLTGVTLVKGEKGKNPQRLGAAGLALHYANMINQIDNIVSVCLYLGFPMILCLL